MSQVRKGHKYVLAGFTGLVMAIVGLIFTITNFGMPWFMWLLTIGFIIFWRCFSYPEKLRKHVSKIVEANLARQDIVLKHIAYINADRFLVVGMRSDDSQIVLIVDGNGDYPMFENDKELMAQKIAGNKL